MAVVTPGTGEVRGAQPFWRASWWRSWTHGTNAPPNRSPPRLPKQMALRHPCTRRSPSRVPPFLQQTPRGVPGPSCLPSPPFSPVRETGRSTGWLSWVDSSPPGRREWGL